MHLVQLAPRMAPAGDLDQPRLAGAGIGIVEAIEAGVGIGVQEAATRPQQRLGMLTLAIRRVEVEGRRRSG